MSSIRRKLTQGLLSFMTDCRSLVSRHDHIHGMDLSSGGCMEAFSNFPYIPSKEHTGI